MSDSQNQTTEPLLPRMQFAGIAALLDGFRIVVDPGDAQAGTRSYGYFATEKDAIDYAMGHRDRLGLDRCVSWYVEHSDA